MRWPSKDPDDYAAPGRWDTDPPRWVAKLRGKPDPDSIPYWLSVPTSAIGFLLGGVLGAPAGWDAFLTAWAGAILAQILLVAAWRASRRRRKGDPVS